MTILTYHRIVPIDKNTEKMNLCVSPSSFYKQISFLLDKKFKIVFLDEYREILLTGGGIKKVAAITFDDGTVDLYNNALPVIEKLKIPVTFFISTNPIQNLPLKTKILREPKNYLNKEQIQEIHNRGICVASHGKSHAHLAKCSIDDAKDEIQASKKILEDIIGAEVKWFCYPYGNFNKDTIKIVQEAGYIGACSVIRDNQNSKEDLFYLKRVMVMQDTSLFKFRYFFSSLYHLIHSTKNKKRWKELR